MIKKYDELVSKLQSATIARKISWGKTSGHNEYQTAIGTNSVSIRFHPAIDFGVVPDDTRTYVTMLIYNDKGENIDVITAEKGDYDYGSLFELYECVRRASLKVDETLDEMLAVLNK